MSLHLFLNIYERLLQAFPNIDPGMTADLILNNGSYADAGVTFDISRQAVRTYVGKRGYKQTSFQNRDLAELLDGVTATPKPRQITLTRGFNPASLMTGEDVVEIGSEGLEHPADTVNKASTDYMCPACKVSALGRQCMQCQRMFLPKHKFNRRCKKCPVPSEDGQLPTVFFRK